MQPYSLDIDLLPGNVAIFKKKDNDFIIVGFNKSAEVTEQISRRKLLGKKLTDIFPAVKEFGLFDLFLRVEETGKMEVHDTNFYEDSRISGWRRNTVIKLKEGTIASFYEDRSLEKELELHGLKLEQELTETEALLEHQKRMFQHIMENSEVVSVQGYNKNHEVIYWNKGSESLYGYSAKEAIGQTLETLIIPKNMRVQTSKLIDQWINDNIPIPSTELTLVNKEGKDVHVFSQHVMVKDGVDQCEMYCIDINLSGQYKLQKEILIQKNFLRTIINVIPDLIWLKDTNGKYLACNTKFEKLYGAKESDIVGKDDFDFVRPELAQFFQDNDRMAIEKGGSRSNDELLTFADGYAGLFETIKTPIKDNEHNLIGVLGIARDITKRKEREKKLEYYANYDLLTGLVNRTLFMDRLTHLMDQRKTSEQYSALLFIDLDHFKEINDTFGHSIGDEILKLVSHSLKKILRKEDTLSRHGGDEFTILLEKVETPMDAAKIAQKILHTLKTPFMIQNHQFYVTASIGITIAPQDSDIPENLLRFADIAMYKAKGDGRNRYAFYTEKLSSQAQERILIETELRKAVRNHEFELYYQPHINAVKEKVVGAEALIRWNHPEDGLVMPGKFISIAESSGQIIEIGKWVIKQAMKDMKKWKEDHLDIEIISINLSVKQLQDKTLLPSIIKSLKITGCHPSWIEFEVTEGYAMSDYQSDTSVLQEIHNLGCKISIDDFGTGYSSLAYLKRLPIHKIKIDQSFVKDIPGNSDDEAIVSAVILIAKSMNLEVIAEGVETISQQEFLLEHHCHFSQGYLYTKPIPKNEFETYFKSASIQKK